MKTTAQKLVVIAIIAMLGITVYAQNTKSIKVSYFKEKLTDVISIHAEKTSAELSEQLDNLKIIAMFTPSENITASYPDVTELLSADIAQELKNKVFFVPSEYDSEFSMDLEMELLKDELKKVVKYSPEEAYEITELENIVSELAKDVRYTPSAI